MEKLCSDWRYTFLSPDLPRAYQRLETLCLDRLRELQPCSIPREVSQRLHKELLSIHTKKEFASVFLVSRRAAESLAGKGYAIGSRGCVASSYAAFLLGITDIDPLKYRIPCETLLGVRGKLPDIILNIPEGCLDEVLAALAGDFPCRNYLWDGTVWRASDDPAAGGTPYGDVFLAPDRDALESLPPALDAVRLEELKSSLPKIDLLSHPVQTLLKILRETTGVFCSADDAAGEETVSRLLTDPKGDPEFGTERMRELLSAIKPKTLDDLIRLNALAHADGGWEDNAETLLKDGTADFQNVIACRDDERNRDSRIKRGTAVRERRDWHSSQSRRFCVH